MLRAWRGSRRRRCAPPSWTVGTSLKAGGRGWPARRRRRRVGGEAGGRGRHRGARGRRDLLGLTDIEARPSRRIPTALRDQRRRARRGRRVAARRCARAARSCCAAPPTSTTTRRPTRPTSGSSTSSRPTRAGCCGCSRSTGRSRPSTSALAARSTSARELVAPGLSMIGAEAGCRYVERVPAYLNNLYRLGLIWFSREPLRTRSATRCSRRSPRCSARCARPAAARPSAAAST